MFEGKQKYVIYIYIYNYTYYTYYIYILTRVPPYPFWLEQLQSVLLTTTSQPVLAFPPYPAMSSADNDKQHLRGDTPWENNIHMQVYTFISGYSQWLDKFDCVEPQNFKPASPRNRSERGPPSANEELFHVQLRALWHGLEAARRAETESRMAATVEQQLGNLKREQQQLGNLKREQQAFHERTLKEMGTRDRIIAMALAVPDELTAKVAEYKTLLDVSWKKSIATLRFSMHAKMSGDIKEYSGALQQELGQGVPRGEAGNVAMPVSLGRKKKKNTSAAHTVFHRCEDHGKIDCSSGKQLKTYCRRICQGFRTAAGHAQQQSPGKDSRRSEEGVC